MCAELSAIDFLTILFLFLRLSAVSVLILMVYYKMVFSSK